MNTTPKALLVGASGLIGKQCLNLLLSDPYYSEVEIWVRKSLSVSHPKLKETIIDFDTMEAQTTEARSLFCCLGTTIKRAGSQQAFVKVDHDYVMSLAKVAKKSGAHNFLVISSIGANSASGNFYLRTKGTMEDDLKTAGIPAVSILRPSFLMGHRDEKRTGEAIAKVIMSIFGFLMVGGLRKYRGIRDTVVAKAMIHLSKQELTGFNIVESGILQGLGRETSEQG
ncbi:MAG: NAD(P)H-binding protein [Bacteroidota bacterium]